MSAGESRVPVATGGVFAVLVGGKSEPEAVPGERTGESAQAREFLATMRSNQSGS